MPAEVEASAARARVSQLEEAVDRAHRARGHFERALTAVYRDPAQAHQQFSATSTEKGVGEAVRVMREFPEQLGALVSVERSRAFGFVHAADDTNARKAAVTAAIAVRDSFEADTGLHEATRTAQSRRIDSSVERDLAAIYLEPAKASAALERAATEHGRQEAMKRMREQPELMGELHTLASHEPSRLAEQIDRLIRTLELKASRDPTGRLLLMHVDPMQELTASQDHAKQSTERETAIRRELSGMPRSAELETRIKGLLERMTPKETRQLRLILTAPQIAVVTRLRAAVRDVLFGREPGREA